MLLKNRLPTYGYVIKIAIKIVHNKKRKQISFAGQFQGRALFHYFNETNKQCNLKKKLKDIFAKTLLNVFCQY